MKLRKSVLTAAVLTLSPVLATAQSGAVPADIDLPEGFTIEIYADDVPNARSMVEGDRGTVFVSTRSDGRVFAVVPQADGSTRVMTIAEGLRTPNGIEFLDGDLYVAETKRLIRFSGIEDRLDDPPDYEVLDDSFPEERHHGWRYMKFGPDGKLYMSIGAPCNICDRDGFGIIQRMNPDGSDKETFAFGVRNSVGLEFHPDTGELWFTDNGRDMLGDNTPPGELNHAPVAGLHFGFPFCHGGDVPDPDFGRERACSEFRAPARRLGPHVAPLGLEFYNGTMFPDEYRGSVFIAEHGSWNRSQKIGYRISRVPMRGDTATGYETFAEGWLQDEEVSGRPVDLLIQTDGSLLVSDDHAGRIYRISYRPPSQAADAAAKRRSRQSPGGG